MGEYAKRRADGDEVKIGTCESMYYLRLEQAAEVLPLPGSVDPATEDGLWFRLPLPDEDGTLPGNYEGAFRGVTLYKQPLEKVPEFFPAPDEPAGLFQMYHKSGLRLNVPCHHGHKLPEVGPGMHAFWNGKDPGVMELVAVKRTANGVRPIVACRFCEKHWSFTMAEILPWVADLKLRARLAAY